MRQFLKSNSSGDNNSNSKIISNQDILHRLTPFHAEFLQCCILASQYHYAQSFLRAHSVQNTILDFTYLRLDSAMYLRYHYYAGLIHIGCEDYESALSAFHLCLTIPCQSVSAVSVAARKKSLLVTCLLLGVDELDGNCSGGKLQKTSIENKVLGLPGGASQAMTRYMASSTHRVGGGGGSRFEAAFAAASSSSAAGGGVSSSDPERTLVDVGAETSERGSERDRSSHNSRKQQRQNAPMVTIGDESPPEPKPRNNYQQLGRYHDLISTYISGNANHYATLLTEMAALLSADGNWGLAKRLEGRLAYRAIRQVASVYSVVEVGVLEKKMQEVCSNLGMMAVGELGTRALEDVLMGMVANDWDDALVADPFIATVDQSTGTVSFQDCDFTNNDNVLSDELWMEYDLSKRMESCISLAERVRDLDITLTTSTKYQQQMMKDKMSFGESSMKQDQQGVADIGRMDVAVGGWMR